MHPPLRWSRIGSHPATWGFQGADGEGGSIVGRGGGQAGWSEAVASWVKRELLPVTRSTSLDVALGRAAAPRARVLMVSLPLVGQTKAKA